MKKVTRKAHETHQNAKPENLRFRIRVGYHIHRDSSRFSHSSFLFRFFFHFYYNLVLHMHQTCLKVCSLLTTRISIDSEAC